MLADAACRLTNVRRILKRAVATVVLLAVVLVGGSFALVRLDARPHMYADPADAPKTQVALVLGAAVWPSGPSPYLQGRLDVAEQLYKLGKVSVILVSGTLDGYYNEPDAMRKALVAAGVPADKIVADYEGFDTYSSCLRARDVFGVTSLTVVSQTYHVPRGVTTCRLLGIDAIGVGDNTQAHDARMRGYEIREVGSDLKMVYDIVSHRRPADMTPSTEVTDALAAG
jgi:vancomycin permeability regulator SanA